MASVAVAAKRIEELLAGFAADGGTQRDRERAQELVRTIMNLYGEGIERLLSIAHAELGDRSDEFFARICEDRLVEGLLCLHGLHPVALDDRIEAAMESVMPYVRSHKGNMALSRVEGDIVYLRLEGSCDGCPGSTSTLKLAVERAILERVPEIREVRAEEASQFIEGTTLRILAPA